MWWVIAAAVLAIGEVHTGGLYLAPFAAGAALAAIAGAAGGGVVVSAVVFIATSLALLLFVRPIARRHMRSPPVLRTGAAALVGEHAVVLERIANHEGSGRARIDGQVWTARAFDEDAVAP